MGEEGHRKDCRTTEPHYLYHPKHEVLHVGSVLVEEWLETLQGFKPFRLVPEIEPIDLSWAGDASTSFGISILIGDRWAQFELLPGWETRGIPEGGPPRKIAWLETVAVRLGLRMIADLFPTTGKRFLLFTNNTTTEAGRSTVILSLIGLNQGRTPLTHLSSNY